MIEFKSLIIERKKKIYVNQCSLLVVENIHPLIRDKKSLVTLIWSLLILYINMSLVLALVCTTYVLETLQYLKKNH